MAILITGATGNVGQEVVRLLPNDSSTRIGVRNPAKARQQFGNGYDYVRFDFADSETFAAAFHDIEALFLVRPPTISNVKSPHA